MNVRISIERLILEGIPLGRHETAILQTTVEAELARLLTGARLDPRVIAGGRFPRLSGGTVRLPHSGTADLGRKIAGAVYRGIGR